MKVHARVAKSRRALLDAATEILSRNPGASISEVAIRAGVGRATLYRHFSTREELVRELAMEALRATDEVLQPLREDDSLKGRSAIEASIHAVMPLADRFHFLLSLWNIAENDEEVMAVYNRQLLELSELVEQAKSAGEIAQDMPTVWIVSSLDSLLASAWWATKEGYIKTEDAANLVLRSLFDGIKP